MDGRTDGFSFLQSSGASERSWECILFMCTQQVMYGKLCGEPRHYIPTDYQHLGGGCLPYYKKKKKKR
jgi:hypothetical protein